MFLQTRLYMYIYGTYVVSRRQTYESKNVAEESNLSERKNAKRKKGRDG